MSSMTSHVPFHPSSALQSPMCSLVLPVYAPSFQHGLCRMAANRVPFGWNAGPGLPLAQDHLNKLGILS